MRYRRVLRAFYRYFPAGLITKMTWIRDLKLHLLLLFVVCLACYLAYLWLSLGLAVTFGTGPLSQDLTVSVGPYWSNDMSVATLEKKVVDAELSIKAADGYFGGCLVSCFVGYACCLTYFVFFK